MSRIQMLVLLITITIGVNNDGNGNGNDNGYQPGIFMRTMVAVSTSRLLALVHIITVGTVTLVIMVVVMVIKLIKLVLPFSDYIFIKIRGQPSPESLRCNDKCS